MHCLICKNDSFNSVFYFDKSPVCPTKPLKQSEFDDELIGTLDIVECRSCGHIFNRAFEPEMVSKIYSSDFAASLPTGLTSHQMLADILRQIDEVSTLEGIHCLEIGCSDFTFSEMILKHGAQRVFAFEPSDVFKTKNPAITHIHDFFSHQAAAPLIHDVKLVVMRHVLEHVTDPIYSLFDINACLEMNGLAYIEVPNADDIMAKKRFYDFFYEHVSYFTPELLGQCFSYAGFETVKEIPLRNNQHRGYLIRKMKDFSDRSALPEFRPQGTPKDIAIAEIRHEINQWRQFFNKVQADNQNVGIYGAGAHAICVTNLFEKSADQIAKLIDRNPYKTGLYSPGQHIPIVNPDKEDINDLDAIIVIASLHEEEIVDDLKRKYGYRGTIYGTYPHFSLQHSDTAPVALTLQENTVENQRNA